MWVVFRWLGGMLSRLLGARGPLQGRWMDLAVLVAGTALWVLMAKWVLEKTGSALPKVTMRRLGLGPGTLKAGI